MRTRELIEYELAQARRIYENSSGTLRVQYAQYVEERESELEALDSLKDPQG